MSHFITALWDPIVVGLDFAKQRGQATKERDQLCPGAETCCVQGDVMGPEAGKVRESQEGLSLPGFFFWGLHCWNPGVNHHGGVG